MTDTPAGPNPEGILFERRRFVRINANFVVSYTDITSEEPKSDITQTKNISVGGVLLTTDRQFPLGTVLRLKFRLPDAPDYIDVKVKVVASRQKVKGMMYDTSAKFIKISEEDRTFIRKMVEYSL